MNLNVIAYIGALLFCIGMLNLINFFFKGIRSDGGRSVLTSLSKWQRKKSDIWSVALLDKLSELIGSHIYIDASELEKLSKKLSRAGLDISPQKFTARKYLIIIFSMCFLIICILLKFYIGILFTALIAAYLILKHRSSLNDLIKSKDAAVTAEMPMFVRTICRNIQIDRDIYSVITNYRKIAGATFGVELDILLAELATGNTQNALTHFENRIGTPDVYRLCSALKNISNGIDQTSALQYLSEDMTKYASENIRKTLSLYPSKMRRSMLPATFVTLIIVFYVMGAFIVQNFSGIF